MAKFQQGQSGNPSGRPSGSGMQTRLRRALGDRFDQLVEVVVTKALDGDMTAANLLLTRLVPVLRPVQEPHPFPMTGETLTDKAHSVLDAVADGVLSAVDGKLLLDGLSGVVRVQDAEQLAKQLEQIELVLKADQKRRKAA